MALNTDHQIVVRTADQQVFSVDHGLFLPGNHNWTAASLATAAPATLDPQFAQHLERAELDAAVDRLRVVSDAAIARVLAGVPPTWGAGDSMLTALAGYLAERRDRLCNP